jgi:parvulin-like peptidyl-prolyl isomerase
MTYIIAARRRQFIVDAENEFRAIQEVIAATELYADDITLCQIFSSYPAHMQTRLIATSTTLN